MHASGSVHCCTNIVNVMKNGGALVLNSGGGNARGNKIKGLRPQANDRPAYDISIWQAAEYLAMSERTLIATYGHHAPEYQRAAANAIGARPRNVRVTR